MITSNLDSNLGSNLGFESEFLPEFKLGSDPSAFLSESELFEPGFNPGRGGPSFRLGKVFALRCRAAWFFHAFCNVLDQRNAFCKTVVAESRFPIIMSETASCSTRFCERHLLGADYAWGGRDARLFQAF